MEEKKIIDFKFKWEGKNFDKIPPNVLTIAKKLLELNLVMVEEDLDEEGRIVIRHRGVCRKRGLVECINTGLVEDKEFYYTFTPKPTSNMDNICSGRGEEKSYSTCELPACPIWTAGYLYYLEHLSEEKKNEVESSVVNATDADLYDKNYEELRRFNFDSEIEEFMAPLALPSIKSLRTAFLGEEGTDKESVIEKIANYLYRIGKLDDKKYKVASLSEIGDPKANFKFYNGYLYVIRDIQDYLDLIGNNDDFSSSAESEKKTLRRSIKRLVNQVKGKYIIIDATPFEFKKFLSTNSKLPYIFDNVIYFKDYEDEKILSLFEANLPEYHKELMKDETKADFLSYLERNRKYFPFKNADLSIFLASYVSRKAEISLPGERYDPSTLKDMFENIIGMENVKNQINELNSFLTLKKQLEKNGVKFPDFNLHMMFLGNPGTGKTTIARLIAKTLFDLGYIKENKCIEVESKDLIAAYSGQTALKTSKVINSAIGGVLFIDEAYSLANSSYGAEAIATLLKSMEDSKNDLVVIFAGYSKEMQEFVQMNSGIKSRIGYTFEFADYTEDELVEIYKLKAGKINFKVDENAIIKIKELVNFGRNRKNFGNGRFVDNIFQKTLIKHSRLELSDEDLFTIVSDSIPTIEELLTQSSGERKPEIIEEMFNDIVGLDDIKKQIRELAKYVKFRKEISKLSETKLPEMSLHMLFTGSSGTGKTMMARKITEMLYNIGCIRINKLVEVSRRDLVGEHIGETAPKTSKVIDGALGGVLFIDEAYALTPIDSGKDFGQEAIATMIKAMEDNKDDLVVIFAGYTEEMKRFVNSNSGVASRIGYVFDFKDYNDEELYKIFETKCKKYNLIVNDKVKEKLMEIFKYFSSVDNFGNGRFVDKLLQEILIKHAQNVDFRKKINALLEEDIPTIKEMIEVAFNERENMIIPSDIDTETRRKIAIHELGHAIIHYIYQGETNLKIITVVPEGNGNLGYVLHSIPKTKVIWTKRDYLDEVEELLAGRAAEELLLGIENISSGCISDLEKASSRLSRMFNEFGMSNTLGLISSKGNKPNLEMLQKLDNEMKETLDSCYANVSNVLKNNMGMFDKVLNTLMEKGTLTGDQFVEVLKG